MKMTPLLWRAAPVWLCVAVVCWYSKRYVICTESHQKAQRPEASPGISSQEEPGEKIHDHNVGLAFEDSCMLRAPSPSESEQLIEDHLSTQEMDKNHSGASEAVEEIPQSETEAAPNSENQHPQASIAPNQDPVTPPHDPDPVSVAAAELEDTPRVLSLQDDIPNSVSEAAPQVGDADLPPADCEEETNPYGSDSSPPKVLENTSNVHTEGTKSLADPLGSSSDHATQHLEANASHLLKERDLNSPAAADMDSITGGKEPEDIPTFDEWKRKVMEVEKEKTQSVHTSNNGASQAAKKIQKNFNNYASVECGAKILGANSEAKSTSAILMENMDLYMLNPCSNKIWFVIELCEPIQVKQLDIANFELFSSTPKDFLVSISDRYPTSKWLKLGTFHARDARTVQSFPLDEHLYAKYVKMFTKYIKVELTSHFGSEHFCPLSLIRVFGTSMVEEYEEIADPLERSDEQDDDLDYPPGYASGEVKLSKNLIGSAKDVILNMVNNIAVNVLGGRSEMQGNLSSEANMTDQTPQVESSTEPPSGGHPSGPEQEEEKVLPDPDLPVAPPLDPEPETPAANETVQEPPLVEEKIVVPLDKDEEEPISSTIILLGKEEESDEEKERRDRERQQEIRRCCTGVPSSASCSCTPSLLEYLRFQCSAWLAKKRKCQAVYRKQKIPSIQKPVWLQPPSSDGPPESQQLHTEAHERRQAAELEPKGGAGPVQEPVQPPPQKESMSEAPLLEPSQTTNLPPSAPDSSAAKPTPMVDTLQLSSKKPENSQDLLAEETHTGPPVSHGNTVGGRPVPAATVDDTSVELAEETSDHHHLNTPMETLDRTSPPQVLQPTASSPLEHQLDPPAVDESATSAEEEEAHPAPDTVTEPEPSGGLQVVSDPKMEDFVEDLSASSPLPASPSLSDIYADPPNGTEQNGNPVHGSSQKESVFMRLNNRIKALEMNMSLSGRYLEQLSQRYRKQMEEMQKTFNKTIIKLQNTSRMAEEQDQRQTEFIQLLQVQLENMSQLVVNLSVRVGRLQDEVSDGQRYLLLSLLLSLCLGLLLCTNYHRFTSPSPNPEPKPPLAKSYTFCCPESEFSCNEMSLKRSASYPLIHSDSCRLDAAVDPDVLDPEDTQRFCPANRKRRHRKMKPPDRVETLKPSFHATLELCNGGVQRNGVPVHTPVANRLLQPWCGNLPSEGSSEGSSHSDDPSFCGFATACTQICDKLPPPTSQAGKRGSRRRRSKPSSAVVDLLSIPRRGKSKLLPFSSMHDLMNKKLEQSSGTFGVNVPLSGPV